MSSVTVDSGLAGAGSRKYGGPAEESVVSVLVKCLKAHSELGTEVFLLVRAPHRTGSCSSGKSIQDASLMALLQDQEITFPSLVGMVTR